MIHTGFYIGLMSGTSLDAIDAVLVDISPPSFHLIGACSRPIAEPLRQAILALCQPGDNEIDRLGQLDRVLGLEFAQAVQQLLADHQISPDCIQAIGSHGQTIRHRPGLSPPFTLQIGDPASIAHQTGILTIADFRRADIAVGGQGAPLVPAFHAWRFHTGQPAVVANIGGMANISCLDGDRVLGFDTGPGNVLLDHWCRRHWNRPYDENGALAASGQVQAQLLQALLADPYFALPAPKSTGREYFNPAWLEPHLASLPELAPEDVLCTLTQLTALSLAQGIQTSLPSAERIWLCGGGAYNDYLRDCLAKALPQAQLALTDELGLPAQWVEACAFAWLAFQRLHRLPGNLPAVTGAHKAVPLGAIHQP